MSELVKHQLTIAEAKEMLIAKASQQGVKNFSFRGVLDIGKVAQLTGDYQTGGYALAFEWPSAHKSGKLRALFSLDETHHGVLRHLSVAHKSRVPTWEELLQARSIFFEDDTDCMMVMPVEEDYVNVHKYAFHIWEIPEKWAVQ